jgi:L-ascorbate metabolism protein UlaG (beta-lactamase superfamily)
MEIVYINHACLKITENGSTILTDPWIINLPVKATSVWKMPPIEMNTDEIIKGVDYVYISHSHEDHFHIPSLNLIPRDTKIIVPGFPNHDFNREKLIENVLKLMGFEEIISIGPWEGIVINESLRVDLVPAAESRYFDWENSGIVVSSKTTTILNMNDNVPDDKLCRDIQKRFNKIDIAFVQTAGISAHPSCFEMSRKQKENAIKKKVNDFTFQDLIMDIIKPNYVVPFAGDFGWFHKFQYDHNYFARATPTDLNNHIKKKGFKLIPMQPSDSFTTDRGFVEKENRIDWYNYELYVENKINLNKQNANIYYRWFIESNCNNLFNKSFKRISSIQEYYSTYRMKMTASICYFIKGYRSNFSITIKAIHGKPLIINIMKGAVTGVDQIYTVPEFIWASILEGKILWNNIQWLCIIKENSPFNDDIRDLIFWLGYYIDLGSRNPEVILDSVILNNTGPLVRLDLKPNRISNKDIN